MDDGNPAHQATGYKKPPKDKRFKPGQSGNPRGRPKASAPQLSSSLIKLLSKSIVATANGKKVRITGLDALLSQAFKQAVTGNAQSLKLLLGLAEKEKIFVSPTVEGGLTEEIISFMENLGQEKCRLADIEKDLQKREEKLVFSEKERDKNLKKNNKE